MMSALVVRISFYQFELLLHEGGSNKLLFSGLCPYLMRPQQVHRFHCQKAANHVVLILHILHSRGTCLDTVRRKFLEGIWIKRRKLKMNGKKEIEETLSILDQFEVYRLCRHKLCKLRRVFHCKKINSCISGLFNFSMDDHG